MAPHDRLMAVHEEAVHDEAPWRPSARKVRQRPGGGGREVGRVGDGERKREQGAGPEQGADNFHEQRDLPNDDEHPVLGTAHDAKGIH